MTKNLYNFERKLGNKPSKTIEVKKIREYVNDRLECDTIDRDTKIVLCNMLEDILMATNNYHGFNYVYWLIIFEFV